MGCFDKLFTICQQISFKNCHRTYMKKIEGLYTLFYEIFSNKNLANKKCALRRIKKRSGRFCPDLFIMAFDATSYKSSASPIGRRKDSTISRIPSLNP